MFTGIVEETGAIRSLRRTFEGAELEVSARSVLRGLRPGDSISVSGVCLTATRAGAEGFTCDLSAETLARTTLGNAEEGAAVNLERPLEVGARLGGPFVLGHVDGVGRLRRSAPSGSGAVMSFTFPRELERYLVWKGSIAIDGISLTIAALAGEEIEVAVIPHTLEVTNLPRLRPGDPVNLEVDVLGKYFERFFELGLARERPVRLTEAYLREQGF